MYIYKEADTVNLKSTKKMENNTSMLTNKILTIRILKNWSGPHSTFSYPVVIVNQK
jgi:hypothetical protein